MLIDQETDEGKRLWQRFFVSQYVNQSLGHGQIISSTFYNVKAAFESSTDSGVYFSARAVQTFPNPAPRHPQNSRTRLVFVFIESQTDACCHTVAELSTAKLFQAPNRGDPAMFEFLCPAKMRSFTPVYLRLTTFPLCFSFAVHIHHVA